MLTGEYLHTIDAKSRVFVPAKLRESLGETFVLSRSVDGCLSLYHLDEWKKLTDKVAVSNNCSYSEVRRYLHCADVKSAIRALFNFADFFHTAHTKMFTVNHKPAPDQ